MRILVTGASGMLGSHLVNAYQESHEVYATGGSSFLENEAINYMQFDLSSDGYEELLNWANPEIIVHCGAVTNGNYCQAYPGKALEVNGISLKKFLDASSPKVKIIYISTDAVFPSALHLAKESDCTIPESIYGKSKELGEFFLKSSIEREFVIVRTTIIGTNINKSKQGFLEWIVKSCIEEQEITLFDDVIFTPITIWDLGVELEKLFTAIEIPNILHIAGKEICTKYDFGLAVAKSLDLSVENLKRGSINKYVDRAKRSYDQTLDVSLYEEVLKTNLPTFEKTLGSISQNLKSGN